MVPSPGSSPHVVPIVLGMSRVNRRSSGLTGREGTRPVRSVPKGTCGYCRSDETRFRGSQSYHTMTHCPMMFEGLWPSDMGNGTCSEAAYSYAHSMYDMRCQPITEYDPSNERQTINYQYKSRTSTQRDRILNPKYHEHRLHVIQHRPADRTVLSGLERFRRTRTSRSSKPR